MASRRYCRATVVGRLGMPTQLISGRLMAKHCCCAMQVETGGAPATMTAARAPTTPPAMAPVFGPEPADGPGLADATVWDPVRKPAQCMKVRLHATQLSCMAKATSGDACCDVIECVESFRCVMEMVCGELSSLQVTSGRADNRPQCCTQQGCACAFCMTAPQTLLRSPIVRRTAELVEILTASVCSRSDHGCGCR